MQTAREVLERIIHISRLHRVLIGKRVDKMGPYAGPWFLVLRYVMENDGCTQVALANFLRVTPASVALSTKRLQRAGYLSKEVDEYNLRCNRLHITQEGRELEERCRNEFERLLSDAFAGFEEAELRQFSEYLGRVSSNLGGGRQLSMGEIIDLERQKDEE